MKPVFGLAIFSLLLAHAVSAAEPVDIRAIEEIALSARRNIRTGHVAYEVETEIDYRMAKPAAGIEQFRSSDRFWFTRNRVRHDQTLRLLGARNQVHRKVECVNYDGQGKYFIYSDEPLDTGRQGTKLALNWMFDPRIIGYCCTGSNGLRNGSRLDGRVGGPPAHRPNLRHERVKLDGDDVWLIAWDSVPSDPVKSVGKVWISPAQGYNVVKMSDEAADGPWGRGWLVELKNTLRCYDDGTWYLSGYEFNSRTPISGTTKETMRVTEAWFNRPDPLDAFTFRGMGVEPGRSIMDMDTGKITVFDGDKVQIDPAEAIAKAAAAAKPLAPVPGQTNYWLVALCVGTAVAGVVLVLRVLARGRPRPA